MAFPLKPHLEKSFCKLRSEAKDFKNDYTCFDTSRIKGWPVIVFMPLIFFLLLTFNYAICLIGSYNYPSALLWLYKQLNKKGKGIKSNKQDDMIYTIPLADMSLSAPSDRAIISSPRCLSVS